jgi:hypothetical protein
MLLFGKLISARETSDPRPFAAATHPVQARTASGKANKASGATYFFFFAFRFFFAFVFRFKITPNAFLSRAGNLGLLIAFPP